MFERFTERARRVLVLAQDEARLLEHDFIGTEHVLLGLIAEGDGVAGRVLHTAGITLEAVRDRVRDTIGEVPKPGSGMPAFTPRAKAVLELSLREALQLGHNYIGTEHILLGLLREGEGVGVQVLEQLGASREAVREDVLQLLGAAVPPASPGRATGPICPECDSSLALALRYRALEVPPHEAGSGEPVRMLVAYCHACGKALGALGAAPA